MPLLPLSFYALAVRAEPPPIRISIPLETSSSSKSKSARCWRPTALSATAKRSKRPACGSMPGNRPCAAATKGRSSRRASPDASKLVAAIRYTGDIQMPPDGKLPADKIEILTDWVKRRAPWPDHGPIAGSEDHSAEKAKNHWAFQPVREPPIPAVESDRLGHVRQSTRLSWRGSKPPASPRARPADRRTLIRRVTLDLTGLPPTPAEVDAFVNDGSPDAFEKVVDRLLASPRYGERWGRHWLDVARYADTKGYVFQEDRNYRFAYAYRDWVIRVVQRGPAVRPVPHPADRRRPAARATQRTTRIWRRWAFSPSAGGS